jgi:diguanylate cyclase (GGDEF)-like protein
MGLSQSLVRMLGRRRALRLRAWMLALIGGAALTAGLLWLLQMQLRAIDPHTLQMLRIGVSALAISLLALAYSIWLGSVRGPVDRLFAHLRARRKKPSESRDEQQMRALSAEGEKRAGQLNAMVQLNRGLREKLSALGADHAAALRSRDAALSITQDAVLLTDRKGVVTGVSAATATLLRSPRESLVGKRFDDVAPLFEDGSGQFRDHPLRDFLDGVIAAGTGIPKLRQAVLVNHENEPVPVFLTASAIVDGGGQTLGATLRFSRADAAAPEQTTKPGLSLADAEMDSWSGKLLSREPFERRLDELVNDGRDHGVQHALLYARIDDLDRVNDQAGYWAGEQLLWHAAKHFAMALADIGTGYRPSNSRFAALLVGQDMTKALEIAERVRAHAQANEFVWEGKRIACTLSIAVLPIGDDSGARPRLLGAAETLLAQAKQHGGNRVLHEMPTAAVGARRRDDQTWLDWLLPRLDDGRAHLISQEMQPLADAGQKPLVEFFIRVEDDDGVWLEPGYYLPAIERLQQSARVDLWVLRHLLAALERSSKLLETHAVASINLASQSLLQPDFAASAFEIIGNSPISADRLCFEIDEGFALSQGTVVQRFMEQLRPLGIRFALDRCHSTNGITQLRHLPVDYMKLHPSVTRSIDKDPLDRAHLRWICEAAHLLGRKTAAINIENEPMLAELRLAGVDYAQGSAVNKIGPMMT